jgi:hypothetical protein
MSRFFWPDDDASMMYGLKSNLTESHQEMRASHHVLVQIAPGRQLCMLCDDSWRTNTGWHAQKKKKKKEAEKGLQ